MIYTRYAKLLALVVGLTMTSGAAQAQWTFNPSLVSGVMSPINLNPCTGGACDGTSNLPSSGSEGTESTEQLLASESELLFQPTDNQRAANLSRFVEQTRRTDPQGAADMQRLFASTDIVGQIGQAIAPYGLSTDNVADAYAVYWMTSWQAAHGDTSDFTKTQSQAVQQQAAIALLSTPEFVAASDAVKQEMAEAYLVQAALIEASADAAQSDQTIAQNLQDAVRQGARNSGFDLDAIVLTGNGFVIAQ